MIRLANNHSQQEVTKQRPPAEFINCNDKACQQSQSTRSDQLKAPKLNSSTVMIRLANNHSQQEVTKQRPSAEFINCNDKACQQSQSTRSDQLKAPLLNSSTVMIRLANNHSQQEVTKQRPPAEFINCNDKACQQSQSTGSDQTKAPC